MRLCLMITCVCLLTMGCSGHPKVNRDESVITLDKVPPAALKAAQGKLPDVKFDSVWKVGEDRFEIRGKTPAGKIRDVQVTAAGDILEVD